MHALPLLLTLLLLFTLDFFVYAEVMIGKPGWPLLTLAVSGALFGAVAMWMLLREMVRAFRTDSTLRWGYVSGVLLLGVAWGILLWLLLMLWAKVE